MCHAGARPTRGGLRAASNQGSGSGSPQGIIPARDDRHTAWTSHRVSREVLVSVSCLRRPRGMQALYRDSERAIFWKSRRRHAGLTLTSQVRPTRPTTLRKMQLSRIHMLDTQVVLPESLIWLVLPHRLKNNDRVRSNLQHASIASIRS